MCFRTLSHIRIEPKRIRLRNSIHNFTHFNELCVWRSFTNNQEINAVVLGQGFGTQMQSMFEKDLESSTLITLESWRSRSIAARIKERAACL